MPPRIENKPHRVTLFLPLTSEGRRRAIAITISIDEEVCPLTTPSTRTTVTSIAAQEYIDLRPRPRKAPARLREGYLCYPPPKVPKRRRDTVLTARTRLISSSPCGLPKKGSQPHSNPPSQEESPQSANGKANRRGITDGPEQHLPKEAKRKELEQDRKGR